MRFAYVNVIIHDGEGAGQWKCLRPADYYWDNAEVLLGERKRKLREAAARWRRLRDAVTWQKLGVEL